jgi:hypothetical protein
MFYCNIPCAALFVFFSAMRWWELLPCVSSCNCNIPCAATVWILVCFLFCHEVMRAAALCVKLYSLIYHVHLLCEYWFVFFFCRELMGVAALFVKLELIDIPCAATVWILVCFLFCREVMGAAALCVKLYSLIYHVQLLCEYWFVFFFCRELMGAAALFVKLELIDIPCAATVCLCSVKPAFVFFSAVRIDGRCCLVC